MLGKLKGMASSGALDKAVGLLSPGMQQNLDQIKQYNVSDMQDDDKFGALVSKPALICSARPPHRTACSPNKSS